MRNELDMAKAGGRAVLADVTVLIAVVPGVGPCAEKWALSVSVVDFCIQIRPPKCGQFQTGKAFLLVHGSFSSTGEAVLILKGERTECLQLYFKVTSKKSGGSGENKCKFKRFLLFLFQKNEGLYPGQENV